MPGEFFEQQRQAIFQAKIFAVAGRVLPDERDLADARLRKPLGLGDDRLETARAELAAQLRNDAEGARMVAAFGNLDVGGVAGRGQDARRVIVVKIVGEIGDGAIPGVARRSVLCWRRWSPSGREVRMLNGLGFAGGAEMPAAARIPVNSPVPTTASTSGIFCLISSRKRSTRQPATTRRLPLPAVLWRAISRMVSTDSCWALAMNEHVLTTMTSASSAAAVSWAPACASMPIMTSLSTRFLGQPRLTKPILTGAGGTGDAEIGFLAGTGNNQGTTGI